MSFSYFSNYLRNFYFVRSRNLANWAENGVLMLNTCLTVRQGASNSHAGKGWEIFTDCVIQMVDKYGGSNLPSRDASSDSGVGRGVVFLAWGAHAAKRVAKLDQVIFCPFFFFCFTESGQIFLQIKHLILKSAVSKYLPIGMPFLINDS